MVAGLDERKLSGGLVVIREAAMKRTTAAIVVNKIVNHGNTAVSLTIKMMSDYIQYV